VIINCFSMQKEMTGRKRGRLTHLLIRNYEPPGTPLYAAVAG